MAGLEGNTLFFSQESQCFLRWSRAETVRFEGNKINWFPKGAVIKWFVIWHNNDLDGVCQSTFMGSALLSSDITDFAMLPTQRLLTGNSFVRLLQILMGATENYWDYLKTSTLMMLLSTEFCLAYLFSWYFVTIFCMQATTNHTFCGSLLGYVPGGGSAPRSKQVCLLKFFRKVL